MGEEGTEHRLSTLEGLVRDSKSNEKSISDKVDLVENRVIVVEKINIRQEVILTAILWVSKAGLGVGIAFVVTNVLMYYSSHH